MSLGRYLKEKLFSIALGIFVMALVGFGLVMYGTHTAAVIFVEATLFVALGIVLAYEYFRKRDFLDDLAQTASELERAYLLSELIERPAFLEGQVLYDALAIANKAMNDEIGMHKNSAEEYREYIETWIHEIKTPIAASKLIIENATAASPPGAEGLPPRTLKALSEEQSRIDELVEQALFYARSNSIEEDYTIKQVALDPLVKEAIKKHSRALIESGITPQLGDLSPIVFGDPKWLSFILGQLISNSIRYRDESKENHFIAFTSRAVGEHTYLDIADNGIGISAADLPRVFNKGFTGTHGRRFSKTTGIGLYLCKKMCTKMGVGIAIESTEGKGSTVTLDFPQNRMLLDVLGS